MGFTANARVSFDRTTAPIRRRAPRRVWRAWAGRQRWALALGLALLLPQLQARGAAPAPQSAQGFDPWAMATGWLKPQGVIGFFALGGLAIAGYALSQAQNWEALLRLLGRGPKPPEPPPTTRNETHGENSPLITGGTFRSGRDQFIGGEHEHHTHLPPPPKPELPESHTPHNLPERTTSPDRFVGRADELQRLAELLAPEGSRVYLTGMGGVGKSELALQHAYDHLALYTGGIVRLDARQGLVAMASQVLSFVRGTFPEVNLPEDQSKSPIELLPLCWSQWPAGATPPEPVLLILDDQRGDAKGYAAERQLLAGLPPRFRRLITQREPAPTGAKAIDLTRLHREASLELLALQAGERGPERLQAEPQAADGLCEEVGDLPLALVLLGARLAERPDLRLNQLLEELRAKGAEARALQQAHPELGAQRGVVEALLISWEPLSEAAKSLGVLLGVMAPAVIPWELVEDCRLPEQELEEGSAFGEQQSELRRAQLLDRLGEGRYRLHPLVRQFIRLQSRELESVATAWRGQLAIVVAEICRERIPYSLTLAQVEALEPVLPHIRQVAEQYAGELSEVDLLEPFTGLARAAGQWSPGEALRWNEQGLNECEARLGPNHPYTGAALNNLAALLKTSNRLKEAEPLLRRALAIAEYELVTGPSVATALNNLAQLLQAANRLSEAEPLMRRALAIAEASYGNDHPRVAITLSNLGLLMKDTKHMAEAESLMRRALAIHESSNGIDNPNLAIALNNLALIMVDTNRLAEAEVLIERSFSIFVGSLGLDHPNTQRARRNFTSILQAQGLPEPEIQAKLESLQPPPPAP